MDVNKLIYYLEKTEGMLISQSLIQAITRPYVSMFLINFELYIYLRQNLATETSKYHYDCTGEHLRIFYQVDGWRGGGGMPYDSLSVTINLPPLSLLSLLWVF